MKNEFDYSELIVKMDFENTKISGADICVIGIAFIFKKFEF